MGQASFLDMIKQSPKGSLLDDIGVMVDWKPFERKLKLILMSKGTYTYGYKAYVGVDQGSGIIVKNKLTSASFYDSQVLHHVVSGAEEAVYADKAYDSTSIRGPLVDAGIKPRILCRKPKGHKLSSIKAKLNKAYGAIRCHVERVFAHFKQLHGYRLEQESAPFGPAESCLQHEKDGFVEKKRLLQENCA